MIIFKMNYKSWNHIFSQNSRARICDLHSYIKLVCRYILALSICPSRFSGLTPCMCLSSIFSMFTSSNSFNHKNQSNNHYVTYCYEIILHFIKEINIFISISNFSIMSNWSEFFVNSRCKIIFLKLKVLKVIKSWIPVV